MLLPVALTGFQGCSCWGYLFQLCSFLLRRPWLVLVSGSLSVFHAETRRSLLATALPGSHLLDGPPLRPGHARNTMVGTIYPPGSSAPINHQVRFDQARKTCGSLLLYVVPCLKRALPSLGCPRCHSVVVEELLLLGAHKSQLRRTAGFITPTRRKEEKPHFKLQLRRKPHVFGVSVSK